MAAAMSSNMQPILADIFLSEEAREILKNKFVVMIGDSGMPNFNSSSLYFPNSLLSY